MLSARPHTATIVSIATRAVAAGASSLYGRSTPPANRKARSRSSFWLPPGWLGIQAMASRHYANRWTLEDTGGERTTIRRHATGSKEHVHLSGLTVYRCERVARTASPVSKRSLHWHGLCNPASRSMDPRSGIPARMARLYACSERQRGTQYKRHAADVGSMRRQPAK